MSTQIATALEQRIVELMNSARASANLSELKIEVHLNSAAQNHSDWMGDTGTFSHAGDGGSSATGRIEEAGFPTTGSWKTAENIAYTSISGELDEGEVDKMHEGLMQSDGHRANIMNPDLAYVGVGLSVGNVDGFGQEVVFLTQDFGATDGEVLVQEEQGGNTVLQSYVDNEPFGEPAPVDDDTDPEDPDAPDEDEDDEAEQTDAGSGCFVATAAYGNRLHPDVVALRRFRDEILVRSALGRGFVGVYAVVGPILARLVSPRRPSGALARKLLAPLARRAGARIARRHRDR
jgi:hypothetical protein